jgi:hypothetical protein
MDRIAGCPLLAGVVVTLHGCAAPGASARPGADAGSATVVNYGSPLRPRCEDADMKMVNGNREAVCRAYLESVDEKPVSRLSSATLVAAGSHRMKVACSYAIIRPNDRGAVPQIHTSIAYEADLSAPATYYIHAEMVADACEVRLSDTQPPPPAPLWKAFMP